MASPETNLLRFFAGASYQFQLFDADWWKIIDVISCYIKLEMEL